MLTPRGIAVYNAENKIPYDGGFEPVKEVVKPEKWKVDYTRERCDTVRDEKRVVYEKSLKYGAESVESIGEKTEGGQRVDKELERLFGEMGTGKGYGIQPLSSGIPVFDDTPLEF